MRKRYSQGEIIAILGEGDAGRNVLDLCSARDVGVVAALAVLPTVAAKLGRGLRA